MKKALSTVNDAQIKINALKPQVELAASSIRTVINNSAEKIQLNSQDFEYITDGEVNGIDDEKIALLKPIVAPKPQPRLKPIVAPRPQSRSTSPVRSVSPEHWSESKEAIAPRKLEEDRAAEIAAYQKEASRVVHTVSNTGTIKIR